MKGAPSYFKTICEELIDGYSRNLYVDDKRAALVGRAVPTLVFRVDGARIRVRVDGEDIEFSQTDNRRYITHWNKLFLGADTLAQVETYKRNMRFFLAENIERHLIFRELSPSGDEEDPEDKTDPNFVRDEEER